MRVLFVSSGNSPAVLSHAALRALGCGVEWLDLAATRGEEKRGAWARHWPRSGAVAALRACLAAFAPDIVHVSGWRQDLMTALIASRTFPTLPIVCERGAVGGLNVFSPLELGAVPASARGRDHRSLARRHQRLDDAAVVAALDAR